MQTLTSLALLVLSLCQVFGGPNDFTITSPGFMFSVAQNGVGLGTNPTLTLTTGQTYTFTSQTTASFHPMGIHSTPPNYPNPCSPGNYISGKESQFSNSALAANSQNGDPTWSWTPATVGTAYYLCNFHCFGGTINIVAGTGSPASSSSLLPSSSSASFLPSSSSASFVTSSSPFVTSSSAALVESSSAPAESSSAPVGEASSSAPTSPPESSSSAAVSSSAAAVSSSAAAVSSSAAVAVSSSAAVAVSSSAAAVSSSAAAVSSSAAAHSSSAAVVASSSASSSCGQTFHITQPDENQLFYMVDGISGQSPALSLVEGCTYTFHVEVNSEHPLLIITDLQSLTPVTAGMQTPQDAVQGIVNGNIVWTPTAAQTAYYYCLVHNFYGTITVTDGSTTSDASGLMMSPLVYLGVLVLSFINRL